MRKIISLFLMFFIIFESSLNFNFDSYASDVKSDFFDYLLEATEKHDTKVDVASYMKKNDWDLKDLKEQLKYFYLSEPLLFYVDKEVGILYSANFSKVYLQFNYSVSKKESAKMIKSLKKAALKVVDGVDDDMTDVEKALIVHDYIIQNCDYDHSETNYSAYNCLVDKKAVCQGYSLAYLYTMRDILGLNCSVVFTDSQSHSWNYIKIGKSWYHVDLTADDPTFTTFDGTKYDAKGEVLHENFVLSDKAVYKSSGLHRNWNTMGLPAAESTKYDSFFWRKSTSAIYKVNGLWYYSIIDEKSPGINYKDTGESTIYTKICTYDFEKNKSTVVKKVDSKWTVYRDPNTGNVIKGDSWYVNSYTKLVALKDFVYYNTSDAVYCINTKSGKSKKIYTLSKKNMQIFSIVPYSSGKVQIVYKKDLSFSNKYLKIKVS
ncbi:MAG: hypothetical protein J6B23_08135 [Clostridia bacterium]|nr:hypothetical protein [Clostridia bacterium]